MPPRGETGGNIPSVQGPELQRKLVKVMLDHGYRRFDEPIELASGELSHDFIDAKRALARGPNLHGACKAMIDLFTFSGQKFDAVGGLTMGADMLSHGMALVSKQRWFVIRKAAKGRGTDQRIEGTELTEGMHVLVVDDVVTTGGSILEACEVVEAAGAIVVMALALVDRGDATTERFAERGTPFRSLITYTDLDIDPVGGP
ncbi:MAG: phosphoribosyltransferase family protein [Egibacteraceae bacterium]